MYPRYHLHLAARHVAKSHEATPFGSKDPSSNMLHFKAIFDSPLKKVVREASVFDGGCASKTLLFPSACKNLGSQHNLGAEIWSSEKCTLGEYDSTSRSRRSLDQTSPDLIFGEAPLKFRPGIITLNILRSTVQNFAAIGRRSSEITRGEKRRKINHSKT